MNVVVHWKIDKINKAEDGFVTGVAYSVSASKEGKTESHSNSFVMVKSKEDAGFVSYDELTEDAVMGWIFNHIEKAAVESRLISKLNADVTKEVTEFPWAKQSNQPVQFLEGK